MMFVSMLWRDHVALGRSDPRLRNVEKMFLKAFVCKGILEVWKLPWNPLHFENLNFKKPFKMFQNGLQTFVKTEPKLFQSVFGLSLHNVSPWCILLNTDSHKFLEMFIRKRQSSNRYVCDCKYPKQGISLLHYGIHQCQHYSNKWFGACSAPSR